MKLKPLRIFIFLLLFHFSLNSETKSSHDETDLFSFSDYLELVSNVKQFYLYRNDFNDSNGYAYSAFIACQFIDHELFLMPETYFESHKKEFLKMKKVTKLLPNDPFVIVLFDKNFQATIDQNQYLETKNWYSKKRKEVMTALWNTKFSLEDYKRVLQFVEENLDLYIIKQSKEITMSDVHFTAAMGFLLSLDGNAKVYKKRNAEDHIEDNQNQIAGVGMILKLGANQEVIVESPLEDSPALKSGIHYGDIIVKINDVGVNDLGFEEVIRLQKGKPGSIVKFEIKREGIKRNIAITVKREILTYQKVKGEFITSDPEIAFIRVFLWNDKDIPVAKAINAEYGKILKQAKDQNRKLKGLILDFRSLGGGTLDSISETIDLLIAEGILFSVKNGKGEVSDIYAKGNQTIELPLAILVDRRTSSGGEVIAGSLQYHKRAIVLGERTSGNAGLVSKFDFSKNKSYGMQILDSLYVLPSKNSFHKRGIKPDILISSEVDGSFPFLRKEDLNRKPSPIGEVEDDKDSYFPIKEIQTWVNVNGKANVEMERRKNDPIRPDYFLFRAVDAFNGYLQTLPSNSE